MLEIIIRLEDKERVLTAFGANSSEYVKEELVSYLNSRVNDYEQSIEMQRVVDEYRFIPLTEVVEYPPIEDPENPDEEPEDLSEPPIEEPDEPPVEDLEEPE